MQRRGEFSFPGSPSRGLLPPRPPPAATLTAAPRYGAEEDEEVRWLQASCQASPDYSSGTPSPQLWAYHPDSQHHLHRPYPASAGSSPSRAQAIAGYRREMLDLVRGLPESAYELSLRDIVERPLPPATSSPSSPPPPSAAARQQHATDAAAKSEEPAAVAAAAAAGMDAAEAQVQEGTKKQSGKKQGRKQRSRSLERSVSLDTGLLIKLFLPLSIGGKKKVSPLAKDGKKKKDKEVKKKDKQGKKKLKKQPEAAQAKEEEEWWSKGEFSEAGGSSSRTSSTGSSSNSSAGSVRNGHGIGGVGVNPRAPARSWSRKRTGCYAFFRKNKNKSGAGQE